MKPAPISRRDLITAGAAAGLVALAPRAARAQPKPAEPPSVITTPPRDFGPNAPPNVYFVDPDVLTVDPSFNGLRQVNAPIKRLWTGALWSEGPAWSGQGRYLVWSDIPNNRQLRWLEDDGRVTVFRMPSNNSNGNTFDFQARQLSCEHLTRRVVRYDNDGSITVIADRYDGKRLNSPNDVVPHPDGSYWFTDPPYGGQLYEGAPDAAGGPSNRAGRLKPRLGQAAGLGNDKRELPTNVYRVDPSGKVDLVVSESQVPDPNGLTFSPDFKKLYVVSTGRGPGDTGGQADRSHPSAGGLRQRVLRRSQAQPPVHGREPVAVRGLRGHAGSGGRLDWRRGPQRVRPFARSRSRSRARPGARAPCRASRSRAPAPPPAAAAPPAAARAPRRRPAGRYGAR